MEAQPAYGLTALLTHVIGDMAQAVAERPGETRAQSVGRAQAAAQTILAFLPGDAIEAMLAGRCVMFHELIVDSVRTTLRGEPDAARRATRSNIVAMDRAFGDNLRRLAQYRARRPDVVPEQQPPEQQPLASLAETEIADRVRRHQSATAEAAPANPATSAPAPISRCVGGDEQPSAAPLTGLNRQARRAMDRRLGKRNGSAARHPAAAVTPVRNASATTASATPAG